MPGLDNVIEFSISCKFTGTRDREGASPCLFCHDELVRGSILEMRGLFRSSKPALMVFGSALSSRHISGLYVKNSGSDHRLMIREVSSSSQRDFSDRYEATVRWMRKKVLVDQCGWEFMINHPRVRAVMDEATAREVLRYRKDASLC
jgi:hypothetical protein